MFKAICNKDNYLFLVCRGRSNDINDWSFKLFSVDDFIKCCTLTTPIFLYRLEAKYPPNLTVPNFSKNTALASDSLIKQMWNDFKKWKSSANISKEGSNNE